MVGLFTRLHLAYLAFRLQPFEIKIRSTHVVEKMDADVCDNAQSWMNSACKSGQRAQYCLSESEAIFEIQQNDHQHVCQTCKERMVGR